MNIEFKSELMLACQAEYNKLPPEERITMSHFDLANQTKIDRIDPWIEFLKDPRVSDKINEELKLFREAQQRKLIKRATQHDKSVGTAQMINALGKSIEDTNGKSDGPVFIYSYVPLNDSEEKVPTTRKLRKDIFEQK